jgi:hypothetical protein
MATSSLRPSSGAGREARLSPPNWVTLARSQEQPSPANDEFNGHPLIRVMAIIDNCYRHVGICYDTVACIGP